MTNKKSRDPAMDEFLAEAREILERVSKTLQDIEKNVPNSHGVDGLYRDMHTLKGSAQLFGFKSMGQLAHTIEASLDPLRKSKLLPTQKLTDVCFQSLDLLSKMLESIDTQQSDQGFPLEVTRQITRLVDAATDQFQGGLTVFKDSPFQDDTPNKKEEKKSEPKAKVVEVKLEPPVPIVAQPSSAPASVTEAAAPVDTTIRVQVPLLDRILNLVGELVLVRNQVLQFRQRNDDTDFLNASKSLDVVTSELQSEVMKTRMQPIDGVVSKFQRVVRDLARDLGKKIDLTLEGKDTELDKSLLEAIRDPLTHIVRNSCDHGIETIEERKAAGKPETGHLLIRSFHEGGLVVIEVSDDGRGLHRQKLLAKAIEKGIVSKEKGDSLSDREICELIFAPGFSTAHQVTSVSGRGVGMDVVKTNIEKIGGSVEIQSIQGKGTTIQLRIPLTLAIVPALIVKSEEHLFAIPQVKLVELVRLGQDSTAGKVEYLQGRPIFRLRGSILPLVDVRDITGQPYEAKSQEDSYVVVLNSDGDRFGLLVSEIKDTADIVVKPLSSFLKHLNTFSGSTILGDGSVALILDVAGVAQFAKVINKRAQKDDREVFSKKEKQAHSSDIQEFLLLSLGTDAIHAIPLCLVQRLEEFAEADIEKTGQQRVVQYRDSLLPLIPLKNVLKYSGESKTKARVPVVVIQRSGRYYGLEVDEILDVVSIEGNIDDSIRDRFGILGNLVFRDEVVVVVDALRIIESFAANLSGKAGDSNNKPAGDLLKELKAREQELKFKKIRVIYAEDVAFFRRHVSKVLNDAGIDVTTFEDGMKAYKELENAAPDQYNLILSDIEMPEMTGLEFAQAVRKNPKTKHLPMIALTTRFRDTDVKAGIDAGFSAYLEKLNPDKLLAAIQELMGPTKPGLEVVSK